MTPEQDRDAYGATVDDLIEALQAVSDAGKGNYRVTINVGEYCISAHLEVNDAERTVDL